MRGKKEKIKRRKTRRIMVGKVTVGGGAPVSVQSMAKTDTRDVPATLAQISELADLGCEIIRLAVPDAEAAEALKAICPRSPLPVIADIHFDHRLALASVEAGVAGLRINPGNIGSEWKVKEVVQACREATIPIRVGVNEGSLAREVLRKYGSGSARALVESALKEARLIEKQGYEEIKISVKAFDILLALEAYRSLARQVNYPFHVGITEAGPPSSGTIRSSIGIGALLLEGLGDTIRVSLTAPPGEEVRVGKEILQALGLRAFGPTILSCPACGRCRVELLTVIGEVEKKLALLPAAGKLAGMTIAVMGCEVNGPGEARQADVGVAGGRDSAVLFKKGRVIGRVPAGRIVEALLSEIVGYLQR